MTRTPPVDIEAAKWRELRKRLIDQERSFADWLRERIDQALSEPIANQDGKGLGSG